MKVKELRTCQDKVTGEVYKKGRVIELDQERVAKAPQGYLQEVKKKGATEDAGSR